MMKPNLIFAFIVCLCACKGQQDSKPQTLHNDDFNWTITIPEGFEKVSAEDWRKLQNRGAEAVASTYGEEVENLATVLFVFRNGQMNYLEANYQPFDRELDGDYRESCKTVNEIIFETFRTQIPNAKLDSTSSVQTISGYEFQTFDITIGLPNGTELKSMLYSRLFDDRDFSVNILYADQEQGRKMTDAWLNSVFER